MAGFIKSRYLAPVCLLAALAVLLCYGWFSYPSLYGVGIGVAVGQPFLVTPPGQGDKISINTAAVEELTVLPGIGPKRAEAIVAYRQQHGAFTSLQQLCEVSGIGEKTLENIIEQICL
ncbi:ComEA family DNA-binding protein [Ruminococcaceae bacterium OttesenSCG-928-A16]|nr:ComEA family DNA-binding protein [Ruminococcaceae bacterium OttesenSCG-928-A16]